MDPAPDTAGRASARRPRLLVLVGAALVLIVLASGCIVNGTWTSSGALPIRTFWEVERVSCPTDTWCLASSGGMHVWNGSTWTAAPNPPPEPVGHDHAVDQLDCFAVDRCLAIELRHDELADTTRALLRFDGSTWVEVPGAGDLGADDPVDLSCGVDGCVVLDTRDRLIIWDGSQYTIQDHFPEFIRSIACAAIDDCIGLTVDTTHHFDGDTWTYVADGGPMGGSTETAIECPVSDRCVAMGPRWDDLADSFAAVWDGLAWTETPLPAGFDHTYLGLSCLSTFECLAINGQSGVTFDGADWYAAPRAPGGPHTSYTDVSCAARSCMAIGFDWPPVGTRSGVTAHYGWTYP